MVLLLIRSCCCQQEGLSTRIRRKITNLQTALDKVNVDLGKVKDELAKRPTTTEVEALIEAKVKPLRDQIDGINKRLNFLEYNLLVGLELIPR